MPKSRGVGGVFLTIGAGVVEFSLSFLGLVHFRPWFGLLLRLLLVRLARKKVNQVLQLAIVVSLEEFRQLVAEVQTSSLREAYGEAPDPLPNLADQPAHGIAIEEHAPVREPDNPELRESIVYTSRAGTQISVPVVLGAPGYRLEHLRVNIQVPTSVQQCEDAVRAIAPELLDEGRDQLVPTHPQLEPGVASFVVAPSWFSAAGFVTALVDARPRGGDVFAVRLSFPTSLAEIRKATGLSSVGHCDVFVSGSLEPLATEGAVEISEGTLIKLLPPDGSPLWAAPLAFSLWHHHSWRATRDLPVTGEGKCVMLLHATGRYLFGRFGSDQLDNVHKICDFLEVPRYTTRLLSAHPDTYPPCVHRGSPVRGVVAAYPRDGGTDTDGRQLPCIIFVDARPLGLSIDYLSLDQYFVSRARLERHTQQRTPSGWRLVVQGGNRRDDVFEVMHGEVLTLAYSDCRSGREQTESESEFSPDLELPDDDTSPGDPDSEDSTRSRTPYGTQAVRDPSSDHSYHGQLPPGGSPADPPHDDQPDKPSGQSLASPLATVGRSALDESVVAFAGFHGAELKGQGNSGCHATQKILWPSGVAGLLCAAPLAIQTDEDPSFEEWFSGHLDPFLGGHAGVQKLFGFACSLGAGEACNAHGFDTPCFWLDPVGAVFVQMLKSCRVPDYAGPYHGGPDQQVEGANIRPLRDIGDRSPERPPPPVLLQQWTPPAAVLQPANFIRATFVVFSGKYAPDVIPVPVLAPAEADRIFEQVQEARIPDLCRRFPHLVGVRPQPAREFAVLVALSAWHDPLTTVLCDCRQISGSIFSCRLPARSSRADVLVAAGLGSGAVVDVRVPSLGVTLVHGAEVLLFSGALITVSLPGYVPQEYPFLDDMLTTPHGWDPAAPLPLHFGRSLWLVGDRSAARFDIEGPPRRITVRELAEALECDSTGLHVIPPQPAIRDFFSRGWASEAVLIASHIVPQGRTRQAGPFVVVLDQRPVYLSVTWLLVETELLDLQELVDGFANDCPTGFLVSVHGAESVETPPGTKLRIYDGLRLTIEFVAAPEEPTSSTEESPDETDDSSDSSSDDPFDSGSEGPPSGSDHGQQRSRSPRGPPPPQSLRHERRPSSPREGETDVLSCDITVCLLTPGYAVEFVTASCDVPVDQQILTGLLHRNRRQDRVRDFPELIPVRPHPLTGFAHYLALPSWATGHPYVCFDLRGIGGEIFCDRAPGTCDLHSLHLSLGVGYEVQVAFYTGFPLARIVDGAEFNPQCGDYIAAVPTGSRDPDGYLLAELLRSHLPWDPPVDFPVPDAADDYLVCAEDGNFVYHLLPERSMFYLADLSARTSISTLNLAVFPAVPRQNDVCHQGRLCRTVVALVDTRGHSHPPNEVPVLIDCRSLLQGWKWWGTHRGLFDPQSALDSLQYCAPSGWQIAFVNLPHQNNGHPVLDAGFVVQVVCEVVNAPATDDSLGAGTSGTGASSEDRSGKEHEQDGAPDANQGCSRDGARASSSLAGGDVGASTSTLSAPKHSVAKATDSAVWQRTLVMLLSGIFLLGCFIEVCGAQPTQCALILLLWRRHRLFLFGIDLGRYGVVAGPLGDASTGLVVCDTWPAQQAGIDVTIAERVTRSIPTPARSLRPPPSLASRSSSPVDFVMPLVTLLEESLAQAASPAFFLAATRLDTLVEQFPGR